MCQRLTAPKAGQTGFVCTFHACKLERVVETGIHSEMSTSHGRAVDAATAFYFASGTCSVERVRCWPVPYGLIGISLPRILGPRTLPYE